jgi:hypothetical protein
MPCEDPCVKLSDLTYNEQDPTIQNWLAIQRLIVAQWGPKVLEIGQTHESTFYKIRYADHHLFILGQKYQPNMTNMEQGTQQWIRAETNSIIYNLYSSLDSLGYEINLAYDFGIDAGDIKIHHKHPKVIKDCLRCELNKVDDDLAHYLNNSLKDSKDHWFNHFRELRNQITHRNLPVMGNTVTVGGSGGGTFRVRFPDNPKDRDPDPSTGYLKDLEILQYCGDTRKQVLEITEGVCLRIKDRIRHVYSI